MIRIYNRARFIQGGIPVGPIGSNTTNDYTLITAHPTSGRLIPQFGAVTRFSNVHSAWNGYTVKTSSAYPNGTYWEGHHAFSCDNSGLNRAPDAYSTSHTGWLPSVAPSVSTPQWIEITVPTAISPTKCYYNYGADLWASWSYMTNFEIQGSNDGTTWTPLATLTGMANNQACYDGQVTMINLGARGAFTKFRLYITGSNNLSGNNPVIQVLGFL